MWRCIACGVLNEAIAVDEATNTWGCACCGAANSYALSCKGTTVDVYGKVKEQLRSTAPAFGVQYRKTEGTADGVFF